ncbi:DUF4142 domain-containing protein [Flavihumibacter solisilvae]|uniref:DUF4142 domain-containing protein n=1 Tax=Flavihumibacter solisilvae TaxID=1349421 RepID=A0A0C1L9W0_9BACT|nr:DUF4142 domain-containing protein [Flavihumibacter solisilvae]KIC96316.1 hypothetical protein OI18_00715 [Flavihumibacter solisilvae]
MKQLRKLLLPAITGIALSLALISCDNAGTDNAGNDKTENKSSEEIAEEKNDAKFNTRAGEKEANFVTEAVSDHYAAIKFAQLAQQRSTDTKVKALARDLEKEQETQLSQLKSLANAKSISVPNGENEEVQKELSRLTDHKNFSNEWCKKMIDEQEETIRNYEKVANESVDADIRDWAAKTLPDTRKKLDELKQLNESNK